MIDVCDVAASVWATKKALSDEGLNCPVLTAFRQTGGAHFYYACFVREKQAPVSFGVSRLCDGPFCLLVIYGDPQLSHGADASPHMIAGTTHPVGLVPVFTPYSP